MISELFRCYVCTLFYLYFPVDSANYDMCVFYLCSKYSVPQIYAFLYPWSRQFVTLVYGYLTPGLDSVHLVYIYVTLEKTVCSS